LVSPFPLKRDYNDHCPQSSSGKLVAIAIGIGGNMEVQVHKIIYHMGECVFEGEEGGGNCPL